MRYHNRVSAIMFVLFISTLAMACSVNFGDAETATDDSPENAPDAPTGSLEITVLYGSEKEQWMEAVVTEFNAQENPSTGGSPIYVTATPIGSNESLEQILNGEAQPTVWSPASSILIPVANARWAQTNEGEALVSPDSPPLVLSPVVIAMWEPMANALGWPNTPIGWSDIAGLARGDSTWADYGHPEWGSFKFGHTHPDFSNSGIVSIIATTYAATGKTRDLTVADVQQPETAEFIADVESGVIHYGRSTGFFANQMFDRGPSYLSAAVLYENLVVQSYDTSLYNTTLPVVAVYPKEGTFWSDHPYAILNAPWVDDEQRAAAEAFRDYLLATEQQQRALEFGFRPADPDIPIGAPIETANGVDPQQPETLLSVPDADVISAVREAWGENKKRVDVMVVLDVSGSMADENRLENAKVALRSFVEQLSEEDGLGVTIFNSTATELSPMSPIGPKRQELLDRIGGLFPQGGTRLIDTVGEVYTQLNTEPPGERIRAIVVLSDGDDTDSAGNPSTLVDQLQGNTEGYSIKIFTIAYGTGTDVDTELLDSISTSSGAKSYESSPTNIEEVYRDIATFF
ncbi:MAG: extracellular solute-binding protein [Chloroflexi bacterium AL-W]|nr:extracellular solute-binding protein [Chloroflexi bacterium AL-N1]NOK67505.1 extracellular solute-binding protein [Chloroflexi bacterium AL-N10]NOK75003.1 extracellular solute-binding protein [Chloroflexi bacterium AL-N5]NOK81790.1 extracellular solute-binding protein [Chloroflexi bacterium AL-W]NOK89636.1 extracellular solute-binding protein [Chloroflexi bacterium AL-N15]